MCYKNGLLNSNITRLRHDIRFFVEFGIVRFSLYRLLKKKGFTPEACIEISMPNNMLTEPIKEDDDQQRISKAYDRITEFANKLMSGGAAYASNNARSGTSVLSNIRFTVINACSACAVWHFVPKRPSKSKGSKKFRYETRTRLSSAY